MLRQILLALAISLPPAVLVVDKPLMAQEIAISSPSSGTKVKPGQTISVEVSAVPNTFQAVYLRTGMSRVVMLPVRKPPYVLLPFTFRHTLLGPITLNATGLISVDDIRRSPSVLVDAEPSEKIESLKVHENADINLGGVGWGLKPHIWGKFAGGSLFELDKSSRLSCSSANNEIATVDSTCLIIATGVGKTIITVTYDNQQSAKVDGVRAEWLKTASDPDGFRFCSTSVNLCLDNAEGIEVGSVRDFRSSNYLKYT